MTGYAMMQTNKEGPRMASPDQRLREHRQTWHSFMRYAIAGAAAAAVLLLAMRLFLV